MRSFWVRYCRRAGVGVVCWEVDVDGLMSWVMPKDLYFPSAGGAGGKRLRSSGGRERRSSPEAWVGRGSEGGWLMDSR